MAFEDSDRSTPAARLRAAREAAGLSRSDLAARLGVTYSTIANAENGKGVTLDWLWRVAGVLGCDPHDLDERLASNRKGRRRR